jgi:hypothetical protein
MNYPISQIDRAHKSDNGGIGPLVRSADMKSSKIYLLDGTFLGVLASLF